MEDYWQRVARGPAAAPDTGATFSRAFWKPLEPFLTGITRVYVAPDGVLNRVSWAAIPGDDGHLLIEKYDIDVLLSTKDLLRKEHPSVNRRAVLIGNPAFDLTQEQQRVAVDALGKKPGPQTLVAGLGQPAPLSDQPPSTQASDIVTNYARGERSRDTQSQVLDPLPGTQKEIESIGALLQKQGWKVETYTQQNALEEVIKSVRNPEVLHIATHGFFEPDQVVGQSDQVSDEPPSLEDPMLRSGLYFAGANRTLAKAAKTDLEDGVMTAFESTGLNLQGTELVVLSACETGMGHIRSGEGVFGLQRAMQEAGANAVLMSMWSVPDKETQELITMFYAKWLSGRSKHEALHEAQLELRKETIAKWGDDRPHYWAAFVLVGR
jgi:CHAT domain-containing protein